MKNKVLGLMGLIALIIVLLIFFVYAGGGGIPSLPSLSDGYTVVCKVGIDYKIDWDPFTADIVSVDCMKTGDECLTLMPFAIFTEKHNLRMISQGKTIDDKTFQYGEFSEVQTKELSGCIKKGVNSVTIEFLNLEKDEIIDSREATIR